MKKMYRVYPKFFPSRLVSSIASALFIGLTVFISCKQGTTTSDKRLQDSLAIREGLGESEVLSPAAALKQMQLEKGLQMKLVAAEPLVNAPIAMTFDERGRMWVVEMQSYMPDENGSGENEPSGKIVILEDTNADGVADTRKIFLDSLVLPRALCLIEDGLLVGEPPNLWYVKNENDHAGKKLLVDSSYAEGGNVEHQPNGLLRALDNWIYNAKSAKRYKKKGDKWLIDDTHFRGQWGITQDDDGRLFYNTNSENLLGDYFPPGLGAGNVNQRRVAGFDEKVVADNRVFPVRATTGVNRGYQKGILNDSLRLVNFTAASGPVIYRGDLFPAAYYGNAFVPEPAGNLIKRDVLKQEDDKIIGKQAYSNVEFLASSDERFRPVNLYNGPDGALYVVDMYRGIIQHKTYLTDYLKKEIKSRKLDRPLNCGRIYKLIPEGKVAHPVTLSKNPDQLIQLLQHPNGWVRDKAQQMIVDGKYMQLVPALRSLLQRTDQPLAVIHSLWTLQGLDALQPGDVSPLLHASSWRIRRQALAVIPALVNKKNFNVFRGELDRLLQEKDSLVSPYLAFIADTLKAVDKGYAENVLKQLINTFPTNIYVAGAIVSNLQNREAAYIKNMASINPDTNLAVNRALKKVVADINNRTNAGKAKMLEKEYPQGVALFKSVCQTCHGNDGNGIRSLAPPLNRSDWVTGDKNKLIPIVLYGLTGPVKISGTVYGPPEINGDMPGIGNNSELSDEAIAQVLSYIRNSWSNNAAKVTAADVKSVRNKYKGRQKAFTEEELKH